ncbi:LysR family transcriptional regulator [Rhizobiaceae bacterium BDR2-2]|uniref:LysR family transcriptional regulator n=1 Tax=Ectorhizobium quercum TaxID=2965071 RepID=A0AAE3N1I7_9HYPH|nr:LysR family transcriptional regulator [Ectorhizobium quercum]MCX8998247.1 LysR family transcriptional regulator [Ectorhizobium quercum]
MTLEQLRIFLEVATLQHVTRAARRLNMTQSAVSAAITALEMRHGVVLFDRVGRTIVLNPNGQQFMREAQAVLASARAAEAALADLSGLMHGELTIMASQTIAGHWLPARLVAFREAWPGIRLDLGIGNTSEVAEAVSEGRAEIGLIEWPNPKRGLAMKAVAEDEMIVVVAPSHRWADRAGPVTQLSESPWVLRETGSGTRLAFGEMLAREGLGIADIEIALTLPGNMAVIGAVTAGLGATLVSRSAVEASLMAGMLCEAPVRPVPRPFFVVTHEERYRSRAAQAFEAFLADG